MLKKLTIFTFLFIANSTMTFAINDLNIINDVNFHINTKDTATATTITASTGSVATNIKAEIDSLNITLDNLSNITFNTTIPGQYLNITKLSGSDDFTISPACPTTTATLTGTGAQTILKLEVMTTTSCFSNVVITQSGGTTNISEAGTTDTYTISLFTSPTSDVVITINPDSNVLVSPSTITFTPAGWNIPQTITVQAVNDTIVEGAHTGIITHSATSLDLSYNGIAISNVIAYITDNDVPSGGGGGGVVLPIPTPTPDKDPDTGTTDDADQPSTLDPDQTAYTCNRVLTEETPFNDTSFHWANKDITEMYNRCIIDGKTYDIFAPDDNASRAELVKIVLRTFNIPLIAWERQYEDVNIEDWFAKYITKSSKLGIVQGYIIDGINVFKPNQTITRAEALKVILKTKGIENFEGYENKFADVEKNAWYRDFIAYAHAKKITQGYYENYSNKGFVKDFYSLPSLLEVNDKGPEIIVLREILNQLGYYSDISNDVFDANLKNTLTDFQNHHEIDRNGDLDLRTRNLLLNSQLNPVSINVFRPNAFITRAEIAKMTLLVEDL